jgi:clan AA aspartic protease
MIAGVVQFPEAWVQLEVHGRRGTKHVVDAVIDTGFTGSLTLPPKLVGTLGLRWKSFGRAILADGSVCLFDVYIAKVTWDGRVRVIRVNEADTDPLVGMSLMKGYKLTMQIRKRGKITIKRIP